jgi:uncharacterized protein (DUF1015 family)
MRSFNFRFPLKSQEFWDLTVKIYFIFLYNYISEEKMAIFRPFKAFRPVAEKAADIAAPPYDVVNSAEARDYVKGKPLSFLHIGKPEIDLDENISPYDDKIYEQGKINLQKLIADGFLVQDPEPYFYLYAQTMDGRTQFGFVGCASCEDYWNDVVKKHEHTRKVKE